MDGGAKMNLKSDMNKLEELAETLRVFRSTKDARTKTLLISYIQNLIREIYKEKINE